MLTSLKDILSYIVIVEERALGRVTDVYFDDDTWAVKYFVVRLGNIVRGRRVLLKPEQIGGINHSGKEAVSTLSQEAFNKAPDTSLHKPVSLQTKEILRKCRGRLRGNDLKSDAQGSISKVSLLRQDPHLRSMREVTGYRVFAFGGYCGRVDDFLAYESGLNIRYLVIRIRSLMRDKRVIVSPQSAQRIVWEGKRLEMEMSKEEIASSPEFSLRSNYSEF